MVKIKKYLSIALLLMGALIMTFGCAEDESPVTPTDQPLQLVLISPTGEIPYHGTATYSWNTRGGSGTYSFTYTFGNNAAVTTPNAKITYTGLDAGNYLFAVTVTDSKGNSNFASSDTLKVLDFDSSAIVQPTLAINFAPEVGSDVAINTPVTFTWEGADASPNGGIKGFMYKLENLTDGSYLDQTDSLSAATTVTFDYLTAGDYAFTLSVTNAYDLVTSDTVTFAAKSPYILWMDDHDMVTLTAEFIERKDDWGAALNDFAWQEFDLVEDWNGYEGTTIDLNDLVNDAGSSIETIVWDESGTDDNYLLWFSTNGYPDPDFPLLEPWLFDYLNSGKNLILIGSNMMGQIWNNFPHATGEFEDVYMGLIPDTVTSIIDSTVYTHDEWDSTSHTYVPVIDSVNYDTSYTFPYNDGSTSGYDERADDYGGYTTLNGVNGYSNITIDVAKDGDTHQGGIIWNYLRPGLKTIMEDDDGNIIGYVYDPPTTSGKVAVLGMNLYFSPAAEIRSVIQKILIDEFGH
ncbi:MAG: hypothetical protein GY808_18970 [Gammaproteobacteria bacterium]|nr:hypothetical protein [Gammaproteobacteria bacterium]